MKKSEKILTITAMVLPCIIFTIVLLSMCFMHKEIAAHFNSQGEVTRYGSRYELFIVAFLFYLIPLIMAIVFHKVEMSKVTRTCGLCGSIIMSLSFIGVAIYLIVIISNNSIMNPFVLEQRVSMILTLLGCALLTYAHVLPFTNKKKINLKLKSDIKFELVPLILLYLCGMGMAVGCVMLNNFYSFIVFFVLLAILLGVCLGLRFLQKKSLKSAVVVGEDKVLSEEQSVDILQDSNANNELENSIKNTQDFNNVNELENNSVNEKDIDNKNGLDSINDKELDSNNYKEQESIIDSKSDNV